MSCIDAAIIKALVEHIGLNPDEIPAGGTHESVSYNAGEGINVSDDNTISVKYDTDSLQLKDGKLAVHDNIAVSTKPFRIPTTYKIINGKLAFAASVLIDLMPGALIVCQHGNTKSTWLVAEIDAQKGQCELYNIVTGEMVTTSIVDSSYVSADALHQTVEITEEHGLFERGRQYSVNPTAPTEVITAQEYVFMIRYLLIKLNRLASA